MEEGDVRFLAQVYSEVAKMNAIMVEVEGMKVFNSQRVDQGYSPGYGEEVFMAKSSELEHIADMLCKM